VTGRRSLWWLAILLAGCAADAPSHAGKGYSVSGRDPFVFEVDRQKLREWGGANSAEFNRVLDEELERQKLCRSGYTLRNEQLRGDTFSVIGRCRS
jgi:hypothetical protein